MFSSAEFTKWAGDAVVPFLHVTTRISTDKHQDLLQKKGGRGFPHMVVMDSDGTVLAKVGQRNIAGFQAAVTKATEIKTKLADLSKKAEEGDEAAKKELVKTYFQMGKYKSAADAKKAIADMGLKEEDFANELGVMQIDGIIANIRSREDVPAAQAKIGALAEKGVMPPRGQTRTFQAFWVLTMDYAKGKNNVALFEKALGEMKAVFGSNPRAAGFFQQKEAELQQMKAAAGGN